MTAREISTGHIAWRRVTCAQIYLFHYHWLSLRKLISGRRSLLRACSVKFAPDGPVGTFYRGLVAMQSCVVQSYLSDLAIRISSLDTSVRYSSRVAHARFIIHLASRQPTARSWFLPHAFALLRANSFFFFFPLFIPRRESDTCETAATSAADVFALNAASINIPYSSVRKIAVRYGSQQRFK